MAVISLSSSACRGVAASYHNSRLLSTAKAPVKTLDRLPRDGYFACMYRGYPFSALVGQEDLKTALLLCAVDPGIGGLLIQGDKGTAKTTAVRGLAALLEEYRPLPREESLVLEGDMPGSVPLRGSILTELPLNAHGRPYNRLDSPGEYPERGHPPLRTGAPGPGPRGNPLR